MLLFYNLGSNVKLCNELMGVVFPLSVCVCAQAVTLPLQGFCNALVYGWSRQMFRSEVLDDRTPLIAPAERQEREREDDSFKPVRGRGGKTENQRYTYNIH